MFINYQVILIFIIFFFKLVNYDFMNIIEGKVVFFFFFNVCFLLDILREKKQVYKDLKFENRDSVLSSCRQLDGIFLSIRQQRED